MKKLTKCILPLLFAIFTMGIVMNVSAATWQGDGYTLDYVAEGNLAAIN